MKQLNTKPQTLNINKLEIKIEDTPILKDISFSAHSGQFTAILGENGAGKTTLLKAITGIIPTSHGKISLDETNMNVFDGKSRAQLISYLPQQHDRAYDYNVIDYVTMGRTPYLSVFDVPSCNDREIAYNAIRLLKIEHIAQKSMNSISGGELKTVMLARCLSQKAPVMLLDEPTAALDYVKQLYFLKTLKKIIKTDGLIAVVSMHAPIAAINYADRIIMFKDGTALADLSVNNENGVKRMEQYLNLLYETDIRIEKYEDKYILI